MTLEELRKLYSDLSDPEFTQDFEFNIRLNEAAGYETTRNGRGWCRRMPGESRWLSLSHPVSDIKQMLWLIKDALPDAAISLELNPDQPHMGDFSDGDYARVALPGERLDDAADMKGISPCHALARAFVAALWRGKRWG